MRGAVLSGAVLVTLTFAACGSDDGSAPTGALGGGAPTDDGSAPADATGSPVEGAAGGEASGRDGAPSPPACGEGAWATYGHDARRTFASDACTKGPLSVAWSYAPEPSGGRTFEALFHAIGSADGVFLQWMATDPPYTGTTAADRVSPEGKRVWTWDSGTDTNFGNWLTR